MKPSCICILGGAIETGNLGVSALGITAANLLRTAYPGARLIMQSWSGMPSISLPGESVELEAMGLHPSNRLRDTAGVRHLMGLYGASRLLPEPARGWVQRTNPTLDQLLQCDVCCDVAGGDSFADIYSHAGFRCQIQTKRLILELQKPLLLLPQTYGPFSSPASVEAARGILSQAALVATRDIDGLEELDRVFGRRLHDRIVCCPDMAFTLETMPVESASEPFVFQRDDRPLVGVNVSGMLQMSTRDFGLRVAYPSLIAALIEWAVEVLRARVLLVPHVFPAGGGDPDPVTIDRSGDVPDTVAMRVLLGGLRSRYADRVGMVNGQYGPAEMKYIAGQCDFFVGARMHACIGALTCGVPTVTLAYSKKAAGVLAHLDVLDAVLDLRELTDEDCLDRIKSLYAQRSELRHRILSSLPSVQHRVRDFFATQVPCVLAGGARRTQDG